MAHLLLQGLTSGYDDLVVVKNLDLAVEKKTLLVLMGVSGSGKTTLLKTILGIVSPQSGKIVLNNRDITHVPISHRNISYLPQNYGLFPHLNVEDNIAYGLRVRGESRETQQKVVRDLLSLVELEGLEKRRITEISGGQQQRVGLARAMAVKPDLMLLDEPLSNIDQVTKFQVTQDMKKFFDTLECPIILVTHQYEDAKFFGSQVAIMEKGIIAQTGSYEDIVAHPKTPFIKKLLIPFVED